MGPVADAAVTLITFPHSGYAQRVRIALEEKAIPYTPIDIDFANKPKILLEANPIHQKIPTIIHNGKPVAESLIILEYLEDEWPQQVPLMPKDAYEKSQVRFWADYFSKSSDKYFEIIKSKAGSPEHKAAQEECVKLLNTVESARTSFSAEGPYFTGETFGHVDVVLAPLDNVLMLAEKLGGFVVPGPDEIPRVHKCLEAISSRPSYKAVVPQKEDALQFFKAIFEKRRAAAEAAAAASK